MLISVGLHCWSLQGHFSIREAWTTFTQNLSRDFLGKIGLLAVLYAINNNVQFYIFLQADPGNINLIKSFSALVTAISLWLFFAKPLNSLKWKVIILQVAGLAIVQYDPKKDQLVLSFYTYLLLIGSVSITSFSGILNERQLKLIPVSMHIQNAILYLFGTILNFLVFWFLPPPGSTVSVSFFHGFSMGALLIVLANSLMGIAITAVYKYADVIIKTFASAVTTSILFFINPFIFQSETQFQSLMGCVVVFVSTFIFWTDAAKIDDAISVEIPTENKDKQLISPYITSVISSKIKLSILCASTFLLILFIAYLPVHNGYNSNSTQIPMPFEIPIHYNSSSYYEFNQKTSGKFSTSKRAICISGSLAETILTPTILSNIKSNLLTNFNDVDMFLYVSTTNRSQFPFDKLIAEFRPWLRAAVVVDESELEVDREYLVRHASKDNKWMNNDEISVINVQKRYILMYHCHNQLLNSYETMRRQRYQLVIMSTPNINYKAQVNLSLNTETETIFVPFYGNDTKLIPGSVFFGDTLTMQLIANGIVSMVVSGHEYQGPLSDKGFLEYVLDRVHLKTRDVDFVIESSLKR